MSTHPYTRYEKFPIWSIINDHIDALVENNDMVETTARPYIVGSLCKALDEAGVLKSGIAKSESRVK